MKHLAELRHEFMKLPRLLPLHLKRFESNMSLQKMAKPNAFGTLPSEFNLERSTAAKSEEVGSRVYEMFQVVVPRGSQGGHYVAYVGTSNGRRWFKLNYHRYTSAPGVTPLMIVFAGEDRR